MDSTIQTSNLISTKRSNHLFGLKLLEQCDHFNSKSYYDVTETVYGCEMFSSDSRSDCLDFINNKIKSEPHTYYSKEAKQNLNVSGCKQTDGRLLLAAQFVFSDIDSLSLAAIHQRITKHLVSNNTLIDSFNFYPGKQLHSASLAHIECGFNKDAQQCIDSLDSFEDYNVYTVLFSLQKSVVESFPLDVESLLNQFVSSKACEHWRQIDLNHFPLVPTEELIKLASTISSSWSASERVDTSEAELLVKKCKELPLGLLTSSRLPNIGAIIMYAGKAVNEWDLEKVAVWPELIQRDLS